jgi:hypothetical protein
MTKQVDSWCMSNTFVICIGLDLMYLFERLDNLALGKRTTFHKKIYVLNIKLSYFYASLHIPNKCHTKMVH